MNNLFQGQIIRLKAGDPEALGKAMSRWNRDTEYARLLDNDPARLWSAKKMKEWFEKDLEKEPTKEYFFQIHKLDDDSHIGFIGLFGDHPNQGEAWVGIGLGERETWGKGYGTDAMRTILRYAFTELNLRRVTLGVFEYNPRGVKSYEKAGFRFEGRLRKTLARDGQRYDIIIMGVLREEWQALNSPAAKEQR